MIYIHIKGAHDVMVTIIGTVNRVQSRMRLHFHRTLIPLGKGINPIILLPAMGK